MRIAVIGTGYVGLVAGTCFAESGNDVTCVDVDENKIRRLKEGEVPIYEPGLEELLRRNVHDGRLSFTTSYADAIPGAQVVFIAVGTPPGEDGSADLKYVLSAARSIAEHMTGFTVVVDKSTVPVGTAAKVAEVLRSHTKHEFDVVSNPEFLKEGAAIDDFMKPDRVVIGATNPRAFEVMDELYGPFVRTGKPIIHMDPASAELTKYAANAMLATRISFMNQVAMFCERVGADVNDVRRGIGSDRRIGSAFLFPGPGYGGSCFPKDVKALIGTGRRVGSDFEILEAVERVNERQKLVLLDKLRTAVGGNLEGMRIAVWGLAFKAETDDMRESPAIPLVEGLLAGGAEVRAHDPKAIASARQFFGDRIHYAHDPYAVLEGADALVIVTEWLVYRNPDFDRIKRLLRQALIVDGRNLFDPPRMQGLGFEYHGIGRRRA